MIDVITLGEILIDLTYSGNNAEGFPMFSAHPGGAPANFLATLSRFGAKTAMIGKVGTDRFGKMLIGTLRECGIETRGIISTDDVFTTLAFVTLDERGEREFSFARKPGADTQLRFEEIDLSLVDSARVFHFGTLSLTHEPARTATYKAVAYAKKAGKLITYDPNLRKPLWSSMAEAKEQMLWGLRAADVVKISDDEVEFLFGASPEQGAKLILEQFGVKLVFVTCGADGCVFASRNAFGHVPGLKGLKVIDTCGAGDIFGGSAVWGVLSSGKTPEELDTSELHKIVGFACAAAGLSTQRSGGISSIPTQEEVMAKTRG